jgi:hypothetical protein
VVRTELYINRRAVDISDDIPAPMTYQIADIKNPQQRNTPFTKTIKLPGTKNNHNIFTSIFDVQKSVFTVTPDENFTPDFNPNLKADVDIFRDGILQFRGFVRLLAVDITNDHDIVYEIACFGSLVNILRELGETLVEELDFSEFNHDLTLQNQEDSWDTQIVKDGAPLVNFSGAPKPRS